MQSFWLAEKAADSGWDQIADLLFPVIANILPGRAIPLPPAPVEGEMARLMSFCYPLKRVVSVSRVKNP